MPSVLFLASGDSNGGRASSSPVVSTASGSSAGARREVASTIPTATQIYQRDAAGVVSIKALTSEGGDTGTGIVLNDEGLILTDNHVISEATGITVSPGKSSNLSREAKLVGAKANSDLALIKGESEGQVMVVP